MKRTIAKATLALAAAFLSTTAHGQRFEFSDLDAPEDPRGLFRVAIETLSNASNDTTTVDGETYYLATNTAFSARTQIGVRGASGRKVYVRYDLENMVFLDAPWAAYFNSPYREFDLEAGGTEDSNYYVASSPASAFPRTESIQFDMILAVRPDRPGRITYTVYLNIGDALLRRNPLETKARDVILPVRSLQDEVTPGVVTATVASNFTQLAAAGANTLGMLTIAVADDPEGYPHYTPNEFTFNPVPVNDFTDIARAGDAAAGTGSLATFRGDFSVGAFYANTAAAASCGTAPLTTKGPNDKVLEKATVAVAEGITSLCVAVPANNTAEIPEGEYTVAVDYEALPNRAFPPIDLAETSIGRIRRDGTRVQIPYLTTFSGYRQNVVIVNRNTRPVAYTFKFVAEEGVAATPGAMAEGMVPAQGRAVLKATDIVSLAGKTRTAATLDVVAASGTVDVATVQVNMNDKGTDTVLLESMAN